ncbi:growth hormone secretagogue receptor type 1-like [Oculina patagonica]
MSLTFNTTILRISIGTALGQQNLSCLSPGSTAEMITKLCAYCVLLLGSFFGNTCIIIIVYKHRDLRKTVNYFIVNMAVSDLLFLLIVIPVQIVGLVTDSRHWSVRGILGSIFCKIFNFVNPACVLVSTQSLVWIAIDRFVAVVFPMKRGLISTKIRVMAILSTWIIAGALNFPKLIYFGLVQHGNKTYCTNTGSVFTNQEAISAYYWLQWTFFAIAPLLIITILYSAIAIVLKSQSKALADTAPNVQSHSLKKRRQAIQMAVVIVVLFYICVIPQVVWFRILPDLNWTPPCAFLRLFSFMVGFMLYLSSTVNPIICLSFVERYRRGLRNIFCRPCSRRREVKNAKREQITLKGIKNLAEENFRGTFKDTENEEETLNTAL